jgi:hypothetical protein
VAQHGLEFATPNGFLSSKADDPTAPSMAAISE